MRLPEGWEEPSPIGPRPPRGDSPIRGLRRGRCPRLVASLIVALLAGTVLIGCRPHKRYDLIEAELRTRERELAETRAALEQARQLNQAYAQQTPACPAPAFPAANRPNSYVPVARITLSRGTGGVDDDGVPGHEALMVVVTPLDADGTAVKVLGRIDVWAWDVYPSGTKHLIGAWQLGPEQIRPAWRNGWISSGYFLTLPWQRYPTQNRLRIAVRLTTLDGQTFETDREVPIQPLLAPTALPQTPAAAGPLSPFPAPPDGSLSPLPAPPDGPRPLLPDPLPPGVEELPPPATPLPPR